MVSCLGCFQDKSLCIDTTLGSLKKVNCFILTPFSHILYSPLDEKANDRHSFSFLILGSEGRRVVATISGVTKSDGCRWTLSHRMSAYKDFDLGFR